VIEALRVQRPVDEQVRVVRLERHALIGRFALDRLENKAIASTLADHQLPDSAVRADMLSKTDAFLRKSMGMPDD